MRETDPMAGLPTGTVTFLFTDIQGSTRLWEEHPADAASMIARHDEIFDQVVSTHQGINVKPRGEGDSRFAVFSRATDGVTAILAFQRRVSEEPWPHPLAVRAALNTGEADVRDGDYYGPPVNRCARIRGVAHGGQTLLSESTAELVTDSLPEGAMLKDLGTHRLKDLSRPQRLYQLCHADLADDFPHLASLDALPTNLPAQLTSFVGREQELADVRRLLETARLVTLTGAGGVGKTRLALQVAADVIEAYPRGVWFADLASISDPDVVPATVARAIGMGTSGEGATADLLAEYCGSGMALIVLDNCEHLLAACAELAERLLMACPAIRILATSREALGVAGEAAWRSPSLSLPEPGVQTEQSEAVRLFIDRARLADSTVEFQDPDDLETVAHICRRLDGIPLAIELAATRASTMSAGEISARLDDRFRLLVGGRRTVLERQQTLRAAIDWSHEPLDATERAVFRRLSVFVGGFTLDGAEAVCGGDGVEEVEIVDLVRRLAEKSLLVVERRSTGTRYRMLDTIRQYAREKLLDSGESPVVHTAHRDFYLDMATRAEAELLGADQAAWFRVLRAEADNVRAALAWTEGDPEAADDFLRFASALWRFWYVHDIREGGRCLAAALAAAPGAPAALIGHARVRMAELAFADLDVADALAQHDAEGGGEDRPRDRRRVPRGLGALGHRHAPAYRRSARSAGAARASARDRPFERRRVDRSPRALRAGCHRLHGRRSR
ncbi:MAG TPA: adenylate/guanylate cyclase domain-containing protein [Acidimicrobiia bacterium]|nr:adenylate/guanylate cyclase domain-containing protein [Acidimicrobiia bacterium]